ncbi:MAG TPA: DUF1080 domain-containing protein [Phycisphaerae bacterium]|nr:DUF1080 domain-containing protein [Phycisphaerae bacterium]HNU43823.1 DUF1080 domain-containing protein [Phycisphaerae bacterium]
MTHTPFVRWLMAVLLCLAGLQASCVRRPAVEQVPPQAGRAPAVVLSEKERAEGFEPLFDGQSLTGWVIMGDAAGWAVRDGVIVSEGGKGGNWLRSQEQYADFILRLEWKVSPNGNSGVFLRCPAAGDPWTTGHEVQVTNEPRDDLHCTGALYGTVAVSPRPHEAADVWHTYEIRCVGPRITVIADGQTCVDADADSVDAIRQKPRAGYIGLQDSHTGPGGMIEYRNVRIKRLLPQRGQR